MFLKSNSIEAPISVGVVVARRGNPDLLEPGGEVSGSGVLGGVAIADDPPTEMLHHLGQGADNHGAKANGPAGKLDTLNRGNGKQFASVIEAEVLPTAGTLQMKHPMEGEGNLGRQRDY